MNDYIFYHLFRMILIACGIDKEYAEYVFLHIIPENEEFYGEIKGRDIYVYVLNHFNNSASNIDMGREFIDTVIHEFRHVLQKAFKELPQITDGSYESPAEKDARKFGEEMSRKCNERTCEKVGRWIRFYCYHHEWQ